jgi:transposase
MVTLSQNQVQRLRVIEKAVDGRLSVSEAAHLLQRSRRQVQRLMRRYQPDSVAWLLHGNAGRPKPWALTDPIRQQVLELARTRYAGFNDTHLHQKLVEDEGFAFCRETLRRLLRQAHIASPQKRRPRVYRARRQRRAAFGLMLLTDASCHDWLQGRGPRLTLLGLQDDATSRVVAAHFQLEAENVAGYLRLLQQLVHRRGVPLSLYRDRHSIFQRNDPHWSVAEELAGAQFPTQVGRALDELGIQQIPAHSPQAKGRIERLWRTFQDRLVSELRLAQASTCKQANVVLAGFLADFNQRFTVAPAQSENLFRRPPRGFDLARCLSFRYQRTVAPDHTVAFGSERIQLPPAPLGYAGAAVELSHQLDGTLKIYRAGKLLLALPRPLAELTQPKPSSRTSAARRKPQPNIYSYSGHPALAATP